MVFMVVFKASKEVLALCVLGAIIDSCQLVDGLRLGRGGGGNMSPDALAPLVTRAEEAPPQNNTEENNAELAQVEEAVRILEGLGNDEILRQRVLDRLADRHRAPPQNIMEENNGDLSGGAECSLKKCCRACCKKSLVNGCNLCCPFSCGYSHSRQQCELERQNWEPVVEKVLRFCC